jgi:hypothetical protein
MRLRSSAIDARAVNIESCDSYLNLADLLKLLAYYERLPRVFDAGNLQLTDKSDLLGGFISPGQLSSRRVECALRIGHRVYLHIDGYVRVVVVTCAAGRSFESRLFMVLKQRVALRNRDRGEATAGPCVIVAPARFHATRIHHALSSTVHACRTPLLCCLVTALP